MKKVILTNIFAFCIIFISIFLLSACDKASYTISFLNPDGTTISSMSYQEESDITEPEDPIKFGYSFGGWFDNINCTGEEYVFNKMPGNSFSLYAKWNIADYTINYGGLENTNLVSNPQNYDVETDTFTLTNPTKIGYHFTGWTGTDLSEKTLSVTITKGSTGNRSYTANFDANTYSIKFDGNNATNGEMADQEFTYNTAQNLTVNAFTKTGYTFGGWTYNTSTYLDGQGINNLTTTNNQELTFTAVWQINPYNINYTLDGGSANNNETYNVETDTFTLTNPTKNGYHFTGWTGTDLSEKTPSVTITKGSIGNRNYTANFDANTYSIKFDGNNATNGEMADQEFTYNTAQNLSLNAFTKTGYTFGGWTYNTSTYLDGQEINNLTMTNEDVITFTAKWKLVTYTLNYDLDYGLGSNVASYNVETETFTLTNPTKIGYIFSGWTGTDLAETTLSVTINKGSIGDRNYLANWQLCTSHSADITTCLCKKCGAEKHSYVNCRCQFCSEQSHRRSEYCRHYNYVYFGTYPQTKVTDTRIIPYLNALAGNLPSSQDNGNWTSYGYYINGKVSNSLWYFDTNLGDIEYRGVYFTENRIDKTQGTIGQNYQSINGYNRKTVYWFKYEPILWEIISFDSSSLQLLSKLIIDTQEYYTTANGSTRTIDGKTVYENNWEYSTIRKWLNEDFYNTAFSDTQKALILSTSLDNKTTAVTGTSNTYAQKQNNTTDKVYLLSYKDAISSTYDYNTDGTYYDENRRKQTTDYAKSQGNFAADLTDYVDNGYWWLRSCSSATSSYVAVVDHFGRSTLTNKTYYTDVGVAPVVRIVNKN